MRTVKFLFKFNKTAFTIFLMKVKVIIEKLKTLKISLLI